MADSPRAVPVRLAWRPVAFRGWPGPRARRSTSCRNTANCADRTVTVRSIQRPAQPRQCVEPIPASKAARTNAQPLQRGVIRTSRSRPWYARPAVAIRAQQVVAHDMHAHPASRASQGRCVRRSLNTSFSSSGAARKLLHVLAEGLRRELQPFDHGQVGEQLVGQFLHGHARLRMASTAVWISSPASGATACTPMSRPLPSSMTSLMKPRVSEVGKRTRHVVKGQGATVGLDPVVMCFRLAASHGGDCGSVNTHGRHCWSGQGRIAASHVDRSTRCRPLPP